MHIYIQFFVIMNFLIFLYYVIMKFLMFVVMFLCDYE